MAKIQVHYPSTKPDANEVAISPETAAFLGMSISNRPTVDEALISAALTSGNACRVNVTVTVDGSPAKAGVRINGMKSITGGVCYTDNAGKAMGLAATNPTTIATFAYEDLPSVGKSVNTPAQQTVEVTLALAAFVRNKTITFESSKTVVFSPYTTSINACCVGAGGRGGNGGSGSTQTKSFGNGSWTPGACPGGGSGGGGSVGDVKAVTGYAVIPNTNYTIIVGANGGETTAFGLTATGGTNGGDGGTPANVIGWASSPVPGGNAGVGGASTLGYPGASGVSGAASALSYRMEQDNPGPHTAQSGNPGTAGRSGSTRSVSYWGGAITQTSGSSGASGASGGGGNGGGLYLASNNDAVYHSSGSGGRGQQTLGAVIIQII